MFITKSLIKFMLETQASQSKEVIAILRDENRMLKTMLDEERQRLKAAVDRLLQKEVKIGSISIPNFKGNEVISNDSNNDYAEISRLNAYLSSVGDDVAADDTGEKTQVIKEL